MKKRVLSVLLVIALLVAVGIVAAQANESDPTPAEIYAEAKTIIAAAEAMTFDGEIPPTCPKCGNVTWKALTQEMIDTTTTHQFKGHYYLPDSITSDYAGLIINASGALCLHLNGNTITSTHTGNFSAVIRGNTSLNIYDSSARTGGIDGGAKSAAIWPGCADTNIYGGTYTSANTGGNMGIVFDVRAGNGVNFFKGTVTETNKIRNNGGTVNVYGGNINTLIKSTTNTAMSSTKIYEEAYVKTVGMYYMDVTVAGGRLGSISEYTGTAQSLAISNDAVIDDLSGALVNNGVKPTFGELTSGASIGFGTYESGIISTPYNTKPAAEAVAATFPAMLGKAITVNDAKELVLSAKTYTNAEIATESAKQVFTGTDPVEAFCYACGKVETWIPLDGSASVWSNDNVKYNQKFLEGKHFFVSNDIKEDCPDGLFYIGSWSGKDAHKGTWCIHLNNKTVENTNTKNAVIRQVTGGDGYTNNVNVMGKGVLKGNAEVWGTITAGGGLGKSGLKSGVNIYGGTLYNAGPNSWAITHNANSFVNIYDVSIPEDTIAVSNADMKIYGGNIDMVDACAANAVADIEGGTIRLVRSRATGTANIKGGTIAQAYITDAGASGSIKLVGAPTVNSISLAEGKVLDLNGMTGGSVGLGNTQGVFTTAFTGGENAAKAVAAFVTSSTKVVTVTGAFELQAVDGTVAVVNGENQKAYATFAEAEAAVDTGYIKMLADATIELTENVTIDLNGKHVNVSGNGTLTGFDSTTKGKFDVEPGSAKISGHVTVAVPEADKTAEDGTVSGYLATTDDDDATSFAYYEMKLSGIRLQANKDGVGIYYKGTWSFNEWLPDEAVTVGVVVNAADQNSEFAFGKDFKGNPANGYSTHNAKTEIENGKAKPRLIVTNILMPSNEVAVNDNFGQNIKVHAAAYVSVGNQVIEVTGTRSYGVKDLLKLFDDAKYADQYEAQKGSLERFYQYWAPKANMTTWDLAWAKDIALDA